MPVLKNFSPPSCALVVTLPPHLHSFPQSNLKHNDEWKGSVMSHSGLAPMWIMKCGSQIFQYGLSSLPRWPLDSRDSRQSLVLAICSLSLTEFSTPSSRHLSHVFHSCRSHTTIAAWASHNLLQLETWDTVLHDIIPLLSTNRHAIPDSQTNCFSQDKYSIPSKIALPLRSVWHQGTQEASTEKTTVTSSPLTKYF